MSPPEMDRGPLSLELEDPDTRSEESLRPQSLDEMIGQDRLRENLAIFVQAARSRGEPLDSSFMAPRALGKPRWRE